MKSFISIAFVCMLLMANKLFAQNASTDSTGLPGDNFSLQGALQMFKESKSLEEFEKKLNTADNHVNNLDLDGNNSIDYIRVIDKLNGDSHAIILRDIVSKTESQDVAVIEIQKTGDKTAMLQIVGDKELYGDSVYVEPVDQSEAKPGKKGPASAVNSLRFIIVNVWFWPCVPIIYDPFYVPWVSPWGWGYYPGWWNPWYPMGWGYYHPYCMGYYGWYRPVYVNRTVVVNNYYQSYRTTSNTVASKYQPAHANYNANRANLAQKQAVNNAKPMNNKKPNNIQPLEKPEHDQPKANPANNNQAVGKQTTNQPTTKPSGNNQANDKQVINQPNQKQGKNKQANKGNKKQNRQNKRGQRKQQHAGRRQK
ncbi:MAG: hypothetical protein ABR968_02905 [Bacteroidales bacterium]|jgi:hypothetical protein